MNDYKTNEWVTLDSIDDLSKMSDRIIQSFRMASFEKSYGDSTNDVVSTKKPQINRKSESA